MASKRPRRQSPASNRRRCGRCGRTKVGAAFPNPRAAWCRACEQTDTDTPAETDG